MGAKDSVFVDQCSGYASREMKKTVEASGVTLEEAAIETLGAIEIVKRYHALLRLAYQRVRANSNHQRRDKEYLQLVVFPVNCTLGSEGLRAVLQVIGAIPKLA